MSNSTELAREGIPASADAAVRPAPPRLRERRLRHVSAETPLEAPEESILAAKRLLCTWLIAEYKTRNGLALMGHPP